MKVSEDREKLDRVIQVYDRAKASMRKILQSDVADVRKVEQIKEIVLQADKKVENILHLREKTHLTRSN